jgi:hypothetical protein
MCKALKFAGVTPADSLLLSASINPEATLTLAAV